MKHSNLMKDFSNRPIIGKIKSKKYADQLKVRGFCIGEHTSYESKNKEVKYFLYGNKV